MKKFLALLLALLLVLSLVACGKQETKEPADADKQEETTETEQSGAQENEQSEAQENEQSDAQSGETAAQPGTTGEGEATGEDIDLSNFTFGVQEINGDVMVTVDNETDMGTVTCVMAFRYDGGTLTKETADYYVLDLETARALAEELKKDDSVVPESVSIRESDNCVTCTMKDSEIEDLRSLTREELVEVMKYAVGVTE